MEAGARGRFERRSGPVEASDVEEHGDLGEKSIDGSGRADPAKKRHTRGSWKCARGDYMAGWAWANQLAEKERPVLENLTLTGRSQKRIRVVTNIEEDSTNKKGSSELRFGDLVLDVNEGHEIAFGVVVDEVLSFCARD